MIKLSIVTPCTRPGNLKYLANSILEAKKDLQIDLRWYVIFDSKYIVPDTLDSYRSQLSYFKERIPVHYNFISNPYSVMGNAQRNFALGLIKEGFVCFLDDDNVMHSHYLHMLRDCIDAKGEGIGVVCSQHTGDTQRAIGPELTKVGYVDAAQYIINASLIKGVRWPLGEHYADGSFIETIFKANKKRFCFVDKPYSYYNPLTDKRELCELLTQTVGDTVKVSEAYLIELVGSNKSPMVKRTITALNRVKDTELEVVEISDLEAPFYVKVLPLDDTHREHRKGDGINICFEKMEHLHRSFTPTNYFGAEKEYPKKITFGVQWTSGKHRSGWNFALNSLKCLHLRRKVLFDGFVENTFSWNSSIADATGLPHYSEPWIGFIHNPHNMPQWFGDGKSSNQRIFGLPSWKRSIPQCKGLFCLSNYHKKSLEKQLDVPINSLIHPTEIPEIHFDFEKFAKNKKKKLVQIGWWLRNPLSIHKLPRAPSYGRYVLGTGNPWQSLMKTTDTDVGIDWEGVTKLRHLSDDDYDELLSENIVFIDLHDSSANNTVIECMVRATPLLVNPLEAVIEYLGEDYPFYFNSLEEAAEKVEDLDLIKQTHDYLKQSPMIEKLSRDYFLDSFANSEIYRSL